MSRQLRFRVWNKKESKWEYGYETLGGVNLFGEVHVMDYFRIGELNDYEIMQFIGLLDRNGKEIYEGDIIEQDFQNELGSFQKDIGQISWCEAHCGFEVRNKFYSKETSANSIGTNCKVIGNVFENPELIK